MPTTNGAPCAQPTTGTTPAAPEQRSRASPAEAPAPVPAVVLIAIHVLLSEDRTRLEHDDDHLNALAADFKQRLQEKPGEHPVTTPLRVIGRGERYLIVAGNNRYLAALRAGLRHLPCIILPGDLDEASLLIEMAKDNELRLGYSPLERIRNMVRVQQLRACSQAEACRLLGIGVADGSKWLSVLKGYPEDLHSLLGEGDGKVPITVAYQLSRLKDEGRIRDLSAKVTSGLLTRDAAEIIVAKEVNGGKKSKAARPVKITCGNITATIKGNPMEALKMLHAKLTEAFKRVERDPALADLLPSLLK